MDIIDLLAGDNFIIFNKQFARDYGIEEAILLGVMCGYQKGFKNEEFYREQERILEDTSLTLYGLRKAIKTLVSLKILVMKKRGIPARFYYKINREELSKCLTSRVCENDRSGSVENTMSSNCENDTSTNKNNKDKNNYKNNLKNITKKEIESEFEQLWNIYPNKQGKTNAIKSFEKARNKGIEFDTIKKGLENYIKYCQEKKMEKQYIKHGSTWFNQECWNDEYNLKGDTNGDRVKLPDWITVY